MTVTTEITIEPLQVWIIGPGDPKPMRRIKILAKHPERQFSGMGSWIYEELSGGIYRTQVGSLGIFPEFNLRYMHSKDMAKVES